jgi:hypothetical protein
MYALLWVAEIPWGPIMNKVKIIVTLVIGFAALAAAGGASAYSARVKSACKTDFYKFCPSYKMDSPELRQCMRSAGGNISSRCIDALVDAGEVSRKYRSKN